MKYILCIAITVAVLLGFYIWYTSRDKENTDQKNHAELKSAILGIEEKVDSIREQVKQRQSRDSIFYTEVKTITNNYLPTYDKINDTTFHGLPALLDSLLSRFDRIPFEKNF